VHNTDWVMGLVVNAGNDTKVRTKEGGSEGYASCLSFHSSPYPPSLPPSLLQIMTSNVDPPLNSSYMTYLINLKTNHPSLSPSLLPPSDHDVQRGPPLKSSSMTYLINLKTNHPSLPPSLPPSLRS